MKKKPLNIYIHIPYCKARCRYCNFYVVAGRTPHLPLYFKALEKEFAQYTNLIENYEIQTIYFGGGTPSLVDAQNIAEFINFIKTNSTTAHDLDISIEANPENITKEKLEIYYQSGVRRLSIGLQAWQNNLLKYMGRLYTIEEFQEYFLILKESKIKNLNIDVIFGIPGQSIQDWEETLKNVIDLNSNHISCYSLEVDDRSIYGLMETKGLFKRADEELDREMYKLAKDRLKDAGYKHYEISNFAKPGFESKHNLAIWNNEEYLGLGASAHSYFNRQRFNNVYDIDQYVVKNIKGENTHEGIIEINIDQEIIEYILLQLRLVDGLDFAKFKKKFRFDFQIQYKTQLKNLLRKNLIEVSTDYLKLTEKGLNFENSVMMEFID